VARLIDQKVNRTEQKTDPASTRRKVSLPPNLASGLELKQIPALDGLRAIAAFLVVFYHGGIPASPGGLGVLAFFVISGFLITWLLLAEQDRYSGVSLRLFYIRRTLRIFPAFYVYWVLIVAFMAIRHRVFWPQAIASFFYVNNYYQATFGDPNTSLSHTWSLGIEEQFYLLWAPAFIWIQGIRRDTVVKLLAVSIMCLWLYRLGLVWAGVHQGYIYEAFDTRADQLLLGCLLAIVLRIGAAKSLWNHLCSSIGYSYLVLGALIFSVFLESRFGSIYRDTAGFIVNASAVALLIPLFICFRSSIAWGWLNWRPIRYLGRISYSLYLYQQITPEIVRKVIPGAAGTMFILINSITAIIAASGSYYFVERPFLRIKDRFAPSSSKLTPLC
jgi:peptidoglycan/LPS O-acetylase OafA/YrhL